MLQHLCEDPLLDTCPQVGSDTLSILSRQLDAAALQPLDGDLLAALLPNLGHAHSRVRASTLTALTALVQKVRWSACLPALLLAITANDHIDLLCKHGMAHLQIIS